jgi:hypothetical protein
LLLAAVALAGFPTDTATAVIGRPAFVGILRPDGLLLPIAIQDGSGWSNAWPFSYESDESVTSLPLPPTLERIPADWLPSGITLPKRWRVQLKSGKRTSVGLVRPMRPKDFSAAAMIGILTDYRVDPSRPGREYDDSEIGVAAGGDLELGSFAPSSARETRVLTEAIRPLIDRAESEEIRDRVKESQSQRDWNGQAIVFPADERRRAATPVHAGFVRATRTERGRTYFYFSGGKSYGTKPPPDCDATVYMSGIVIRERDGRIHSPGIGAYTTLDCSRDNAINVIFQPLATLHWNGPVLWVIRNDAEDGFDYCLIDPSSTDGCLPMRGSWQLRERIGGRTVGERLPNRALHQAASDAIMTRPLVNATRSTTAAPPSRLKRKR